MNIVDMLESIKKIPSLQLQETAGNFFGAVLNTSELTVIQDILNTFFGEPLKPENVKATQDVTDLSCQYGGVRDNQILYYKKDGSDTTLAMIWPWGDNQKFTLKIIHEF